MAEPIAGTYVGTNGRRKPLEAVDERRTCMSFDCETILSRYNHGDFCYAHEPKKYVDPTRGEPRKHRRVSAF